MEDIVTLIAIVMRLPARTSLSFGEAEGNSMGLILWFGRSHIFFNLLSLLP
jgi:hypothetical protein